MQFGDMNYFGTEPQMQQPVQAAQMYQPEGAAATQPRLFNAKAFKKYGAILALMAAATLALGIADVVITHEAYCNPWVTAGPTWCSTTNEPYIWVWVGVGIWASIPIFMAGIFSMCISRKPESFTRIFALLMFLSSFVFAPALVVLSGIEIWRGHASEYTFYSLTNGVMAGSIVPSTANPYQAKFAIPLVIAIIGGIMFIMTAVVTLTLCCCMQRLGIYMPGDLDGMQGQQPSQVQSEYYPARPQVSQPQYAIDYSDGQQQQSDPFSRFSALPYLPTRYNSVPNPYGSGVMYGNFPSRGSFATDFFKPNPSSFWK